MHHRAGTMPDVRSGSARFASPLRTAILIRFVANATTVAALGALLAAGCRSPQPTAKDEPTKPPWFADVTDEVGLHCVHNAGEVGTYFMPQLMGSGAAVFDFDNDG